MRHIFCHVSRAIIEANQNYFFESESGTYSILKSFEKNIFYYACRGK